MPPRRKPQDQHETGFFDAYAGLARILRGWLVAYGVGAPVLFVSQNSVMTALKAVPDARQIILAYLAGTVLQISLLWLYKLCMWWGYLHERKSISEKSRRYRFTDWFTNTMWFEGIVDVITICLFCYATGRILFIIAG